MRNDIITLLGTLNIDKKRHTSWRELLQRLLPQLAERGEKYGEADKKVCKATLWN